MRRWQTARLRSPLALYLLVHTLLQHRVPLPRFVLEASFVMGITFALSFPGLLPLLVAGSVLWRIGFEALLRPGELLALTREDIKLPRSGRDGPAVLGIRSPKNKRFLGSHQFRLLRSQASIAWCRWFLSHLPPRAKLWPGSPQAFTDTTRYVLKRLGLSSCGFTPSSLRSGGATWLFEQGVSVQQLQYMGGWSSDRSLSSYIQEAMAVSVWQSVPELVAQTLELAAAERRFVWDRPPLTLWPQLALHLGRRSPSRLTSSMRRSRLRR